MRKRASRRHTPWRTAFVLLAALAGLVITGPAVLAQEGEASETVQGTFASGLGEERETFEGVAVTVRDAEGNEVGTATSDADGFWQVGVPGPGEYEVEIDEGTLPDGVAIREGASNPLTGIPVNPGQVRNVLFPFGEGGSAASLASRIIPVTVQGLQFGLIIAITAIGLSLIFGTTGLVNFAHGELVTFGAVVTWFLNAPAGRGGGVSWAAAAGLAIFMAPAALVVRDRFWPDVARTNATAANLVTLVAGWAVLTAVVALVPAGLHLVFAGIIGIALTAIMSAGFDRGLWRPLRFRRTGLITMLVVSIGLSILLRNVLQAWFGAGSSPYFDYAVQRAIELGPISMTPKEMWIVGLSTAALVGVAVMLRRTRVGKAMRAVADNRDLAESSGIDVQRIILLVWVLGGALAGLGGVLSAVDENVSFLLGFRLLLLMFAGVILGGLGTAYGALVGSLVVGLITELSTLFFSPQLKVTWGLAVLIVILLVRPQGILGQRERFG